MDFTALNYVDYAVFAIIGLSVLLAFIRGFIGSFLSLTGWILAIYLAYAFYPDIKPFIEEKIKSPVVIIVAGHAGLLIGLLIVFGIINIGAGAAMKTLTKGMIDRSLGAAFGFFRGALIVSFFFFVTIISIGIFNGKTEEEDDDIAPKWLKSAQTYTLMKNGKALLASFIPDTFYERIQTVYENVSKKTIDERFTEQIMEKLSKHLSGEERKALDDTASEDALTMSEEDVELKYLKNLLGQYKKKLRDEDFLMKEDELSNEDLRKFEAILKRRESAASSPSPDQSEE